MPSSERRDLSNIFKVDFDQVAPDRAFSEIIDSETIAPRSAITTEDDLKEEDTSPKKGLSKLAETRAKKKREKAKAKAEKAFSKNYGDGSGSAKSGNADGGSDGGPRAALYKGQMGASQKRATNMQSKGSVMSTLGGFAVPRSFEVPSISKKITTPLFVLLIVAVFVFALYPPAQQCYVQMREVERLAAENEAVQARNEALQNNIDALQTDEGIEDRAHSEFGFVKDDEKTASVAGIDVEDDSRFAANVISGSVAAPETWYSGVLDVLFMYDPQPVKL